MYDIGGSWMFANDVSILQVRALLNCGNRKTGSTNLERQNGKLIRFNDGSYLRVLKYSRDI